MQLFLSQIYYMIDVDNDTHLHVVYSSVYCLSQYYYNLNADNDYHPHEVHKTQFFLEIASYNLDAHIAFHHDLCRALFLWPAYHILDAGSACHLHGLCIAHFREIISYILDVGNVTLHHE